MSQITSHVLDTSKGAPASALPITLEFKRGDEWVLVHQALSNADGRVGDFLDPGRVLEVGVYRMNFDTKAYYDGLAESCFYPYVEVVFTIVESQLNEHFHIPLLLSPYGYSTYRGS